MAISRPSQAALAVAADVIERMESKHPERVIAEATLGAAHDSRLGLDMSVNLREVFELCHAWEHADPDYVDNDIRSWLGKHFGVDG